MAQTKALVSLLNTKLNLVTSQWDELHGTLGSYVDKMATTARAILEAETQDLYKIKETNSMLEKGLEYLVQLSVQVEEDTKGFPLSNSDSTPVLATSSLILSELPREVSLSELSKLEQRLNELEKKQADMEQLHITKMEKVEEQLKHTEQNNEDMVKQGSTRVSDIEKRVKKLETEERQHASRLDSLVKDVETMKNQYSKRQQSSKLQSLEERVESLTSQFGSLKEQVKDISHLRQTTEELTSRMDEYADRSDLIDVMKTSKSLKNSLEDLSLRVDAVEMSVKSAASYREKEENKRMELEDRVCVVEVNRTKDLEHSGTRLDEVESLFKQVCHLVDLKVEPLRRLQRILNDYHKRVEKREELAQRVDKVTDQVENISSQVQSLRKEQQQPRVGFTAYYPRMKPVPSKKSVITDFSDILCNEGHHYNVATGKFTAPRAGVYVTSITLWQSTAGGVDVHVNHNDPTGRLIKTCCKSATDVSRTSCCGVALVSMKAGDTLSVEIRVAENGVKLTNYSSFSCFAIS